MRDVDLAAFAAAHSDGAVVVDVREPAEYLAGHVPGAKLVPMDQLPNRLQDLPRHKPIYLVCASGTRSSAMAGLLVREGYDAYSVDGGTSAWARSGRPTVRGPQEQLA